MPQSLVRKDFPFLPLCKEFQKSAETQKKNIYAAAVFEHSFSIKRDWKASSKACGILNLRVWWGQTSL